MKKGRLLLLIPLLVLSLSTTVLASSKENSEMQNEVYQEEYERVYQEYKDDEQFKMMVQDYGIEYGEQFICNVVENNLSNSKTRGGGGNVCYQYVTNIRQTSDHNCGTATVLQTLYGLNSASAVEGTTDAEKISNLDDDYNVDTQGSLYVYQVQNILNTYNTGNQTYTYAQGANMTEAEFEYNVSTSLTYCKPVILHAKTGSLTYYGGKNIGHYISLDYINRTTDTVRLVDCHYSDAYYGIHNNIPLSEAYNTVSPSGRYVIY